MPEITAEQLAKDKAEYIASAFYEHRGGSTWDPHISFADWDHIIEALREWERASGSEYYVAWMRYVRGPHGTSIRVCDSDAYGAFKVYRHPAQAAVEKAVRL